MRKAPPPLSHHFGAVPVAQYDDIGKTMLAAFDRLQMQWPSFVLPIPDLEQYVQFQEYAEDVKEKSVSYAAFRKHYAAKEIGMTQYNGREADTDYLLSERNAMKAHLEQAQKTNTDYLQTLKNYGTLCALSDVDYLYARLACLPNEDGYLTKNLAIRHSKTESGVVRLLPLDAGFIPVYLAAQKKTDNIIASLTRASSWRVPNTP